jgi:hypothetical protein
VAVLARATSPGSLVVTAEERESIKQHLESAGRRISAFDVFVESRSSGRRHWRSVLLSDEGIRKLERRIDEALADGDAEAARGAIASWEAACRRRLDQPKRRWAS